MTATFSFGHGNRRLAYRVEPQGNRWIVVDRHGFRVAGPFDRTSAQGEADRLTAELAAREKRGPRPCLRCAETFDSEGIHHRLCDNCRHDVGHLGAYGIVGGLSGSGRRSNLRGAR